MVRLQQRNNVPKQQHRRNAVVRFVCVREVLADVAKRHCAQHGIHQRVQRHIRIRMPQQPKCVRNGHAAENQRTAFHQPMYVIALPNSKRRQRLFCKKCFCHQ